MESLSLSPKTHAAGGCTFDETGQKFTHQYWKRCLDCFPDETTGACLSCIAVCHAGHNIDHELRTGNFYCDCGAKGSPTCKLTTGPKYGRDIPNRGPLPPRKSMFPGCKICGARIIHQLECYPPINVCENGHRYSDNDIPPTFPDLKFKKVRCSVCGARFISNICENGHKMEVRPRVPSVPIIPEPWWPNPAPREYFVDPIIHDDIPVKPRRPYEPAIDPIPDSMKHNPFMCGEDKVPNLGLEDNGPFECFPPKK